jgi:AcrR family transcriptional regulator
VARRTQADRSAATRDALLAAARPLFADHGFAGVATEAIVSAAEVTRGALYHHFADKTELFAAVFELVEDEATQRVAAAVLASADAGETDPIELMVRGGRAWLTVGVEVHRIVLVDAPAVLGWTRWRETCLRYALGLVEGMIVSGIEAGRIAPQPSRPLAHVLLGASDEAVLYVAQSPYPETAEQEMAGALEALIRAMALPA